MSRDPRPLVAGNWKMNGLKAGLDEIAAMRRAAEAGAAGSAELLVCPPATLTISAAAVLQGGPMALGAQDCHPKASGAYTGDISAPMLKDAGASYVIVGHSERRAGYGESDALVRAKAEAAHEAGLAAIVCVGETRAEREAGEAISVVSGQIRGSLPPAATPANLVVAYEPVWAIGTGPDADRPRCRRRAWRDPRAAGRNLWRGGRAHAHSLRRLGQTVQRRGNCSACPMSTARWSAAPA